MKSFAAFSASTFVSKSALVLRVGELIEYPISEKDADKLYRVQVKE